MKRHTLTTTLIFYLFASARGQYTTAGKIEYERKINVYAEMENMDESEWLDKIKSQIPKFSSTYFDLVFDTTRSLYKPGREVDGNPLLKMFGGGAAKQNVVYTDFGANKVTANKTIYEQNFLVQDSVRKIDWHVKDELRTIANFKCHKAVGIICDSVYVVAFYTEDILVSGGPEMFGGLPGMIMELAIPRLHTTWVADNVQVTSPAETDFTIPGKGKKVTEQELYQTVKGSFKDWGKMASENIWWTIL